METNNDFCPFPFVEELYAKLNALEKKTDMLLEAIRSEQIKDYMNQYLTLEEAQAYLHCKEKTLEKLRTTGRLAFIQYGRKILIKRKDLDDFLAAYRKNEDFQETIRNFWQESLYGVAPEVSDAINDGKEDEE